MYVCALVGVLIKCLYEMHGATMKRPNPSLTYDSTWISPADGSQPEPKIVACTIDFNRPASWSSGQGLWLLIMRSRVRFPVLPWEFFLGGKDSRGDHGLGS